MTLFDVFENLFLLSYPESVPNRGTNSKVLLQHTGKHRQNLSLIQKIFVSIKPRKQDCFWPVLKNFRKTKKTVTADKVQTIARPSCLTVTVTRIFHRFTSLHWLSPDYFRWHFSHSQNTFFRDMKRLRLFVLLFYHIPSRFTTKAAVSKPQQNRN